MVGHDRIWKARGKFRREAQFGKASVEYELLKGAFASPAIEFHSDE